MLEELKKIVFEANMELVRRGMVIYTWGNVSGIDRARGLVVIKPSGVEYDRMRWQEMTVVDMDGKIVEGDYKPSSDLLTHLELYKRFSEIGGVVHTHSEHAVAFAQAGKSIPALGTTHADYFYGEIPCTRPLNCEEIAEAYELNTGKVIVETFEDRDAMAIPGCVVRNHGPFTWGKTPSEAVYHAVVLDKVAEMAIKTFSINPHAASVEQYFLDKHYFRKHGANAYYGQNNKT